jgi:hypothetical protein
MSEDQIPVSIPGPSKQMDVNDGLVHTQRDLSQGLTLELTDDEIRQLGTVIGQLHQKYLRLPNTVENLEALRDEATTKCAEIGILVSIDPTPAFYGEPPILDVLGKVAGDPIHKYGMDHERKEFEVKRATERGEDYLGQKEKPSGKR